MMMASLDSLVKIFRDKAYTPSSVDFWEYATFETQSVGSVTGLITP